MTDPSGNDATFSNLTYTDERDNRIPGPLPLASSLGYETYHWKVDVDGLAKNTQYTVVQHNVTTIAIYSAPNWTNEVFETQDIITDVSTGPSDDNGRIRLNDWRTGENVGPALDIASTILHHPVGKDMCMSFLILEQMWGGLWTEPPKLELKDGSLVRDHPKYHEPANADGSPNAMIKGLYFEKPTVDADKGFTRIIPPNTGVNEVLEQGDEVIKFSGTHVVRGHTDCQTGVPKIDANYMHWDGPGLPQ